MQKSSSAGLELWTLWFIVSVLTAEPRQRPEEVTTCNVPQVCIRSRVFGALPACLIYVWATFPLVLECRCEWVQTVGIWTSCETQISLSAAQATLIPVCLDKSCVCSCGIWICPAVNALLLQTEWMIGLTLSWNLNVPSSTLSGHLVVICDAGKLTKAWISQIWELTCN